ncbi:hypothetical protein ACP275_13G043700 [Erythranthe tilingii]
MQETAERYSENEAKQSNYRNIGCDGLWDVMSSQCAQVENISRRSMGQKSVRISSASYVTDDEEGVEDSLVQVYIAKILIPNEKLLKSCVGGKTIGEVLHKCIEWEYMNVMEI